VPLKVLQKAEDSGQDCVVIGLLDFLGKKLYVHFQYFFRRGPRLMGVMGVPAQGKDLANNGRIGLAVRPDAIQGVDNANNLTERAIERANACTAGRNEGSVDVEQQQLHAAILNQGEFYFRLQKDFRCVKVYRKLKSAGLFLANKAERQGREQHLISTST
jgi:hypothetical protein